MSPFFNKSPKTFQHPLQGNFEILFIEIAQKLGFLSRIKKLILGISAITLIITSFHVDSLKDLNYP
jgi:hypothetical protein